MGSRGSYVEKEMIILYMWNVLEWRKQGYHNGKFTKMIMGQALTSLYWQL